jgi:lysophospholipid acyltransferase (LPLAT)-like uncharacterized protein
MKKKILRYIQVNILPYILQLMVRLIYFTNKKYYHYPQDISQDMPLIVAMWHGDLLMQPLNYKTFRPKGEIKVIVSEHSDGKTIKKVVQYLGVGALSGSSTRGGAKALIGAIKTLRQGIDVAITPDGPRGPIYSIADGIVILSQKTNTNIVALSSIPTKYWKFNSWDKFVVPKPFGRIDFFVSKPFSIEGLSIDEAKEKIKIYLDQNQLKK